ncbi:MAG: HAMP domain-containing protein [Deltaproteobacteria bacterium]|nr:HAMP domain-containing protein [Deltaproteobacteria bacterium]
MRNLSIRLKLILAVVATMAVAGLAAAFLVWELSTRGARAASEEALRRAEAAYEDMERAEIARLSAAMDGLLAHPGMREAFLARDRERLLALAAPIAQGLKADHNITHWYFLEAEGKRCFARAYEPGKFGDVVEHLALDRAMARRETAAGKELGKASFALRVVRPWTIDGRLAGYVELAEEIDHFLGRIKAQSGDDVALLIAKKHLDPERWAKARARLGARNNWSDWSDVVLVDSTTADGLVDAEVVAGLAGPARLLDETSREGSVYGRGTFPLRDSGGRIVGGMVVRRDLTALHHAMRAGLLRAMGFVALLALVASALIYLLVDRLIFRRLVTMMTNMEEASECLAGGDYNVGASIQAGRQDEIGAFETFFARFLRHVGATLRGLAARQRPVQPAAPHQAQVPPPLPPRLN